MQVPERIQPKGLADYLDVMGKAMFQSGISWRVVESKWPGTREALQDFNPRTIATLTDADLDELAKDTRLIRNRRKLAALVDNARRMLELEEDHGSFQNYLRSHGGFEGTLKDIRKQFKYMGDAGTFYFLWVVGEDVPDYEEWCKSHHQ
ncbi:MAG TPA: DNA-3-methyladenine glycosylase I [Dehalococcoidia bacterium]|jgi:DNA-3-methyladenine glycosylase I|nr:DNA-3-methyladenine glycosylase I [Dehalococcoidia bacterium]